MKAAEFRKMSAAQLNEELTALLRKQFNLRMQKGSGQTPKSSDMQAVRKDIARLKTVLREMRK
jgi:large subunit ribosomal protein L29